MNASAEEIELLLAESSNRLLSVKCLFKVMFLRRTLGFRLHTINKQSHTQLTDKQFESNTERNSQGREKVINSGIQFINTINESSS